MAQIVIHESEAPISVPDGGTAAVGNPLVPERPAVRDDAVSRSLDISPQAADWIIAHPRFDECMLLAAKAIIANYRGNWVGNRLLSDRGRMLTALMVLDLDFMAGGERGFMLADLRAEAEHYGFASPGRVSAWVAALRLLGFLTLVDAARPQRFTPTERFLTLHRDRMRRQWEVLALIHPDAGDAIAALGDRRFLGLCAHGFMVPYRQGARVLALVPEIDRIADRDAGITVLLSLLLADAKGQPVSIAELSRRFQVSRAHVLSLCRDAEHAGLAIRDGPRQTYRGGPHLEPMFRRFLATIFLANIHVIETALSPLGQKV